MNDAVELTTHSQTDTAKLAAEISLYACAGEVFCLSGDLGVGKSVFARAFLRALANDDDLEVPSPTFTLVQTYEGLRLDAAHFDLYRVNDSTEIDELGLEDCLQEGVALVEWPDKLVSQDFPDRLMIEIEDVSPQQRSFKFTGHGVWQQKLERWQQCARFLHHAGWQDCPRTFLQGDASNRRYERLQRDGLPAILMDMPERSDGPIVRDNKPYSALAHLAEGVGPFIAMTHGLRGLNLSAPEIYAEDSTTGFLLLEDLGPHVFFDMAANGDDMTVPMRGAVDVLVTLAQQTGAGETAGDYSLPRYDTAALQIEIELLPDWYWPRMNKTSIPQAQRAEFLELWQPLLQFLEDGPHVWCLRDYHSPNLLWLEAREGVARIGLIDYQDAVLGHPAYDLMSLLQDARRDVSAKTEAELIAYYGQQMAQSGMDYDLEDFTTAYAILGAQRATKILGIFARLADRDNKPGYLVHVPRVQAYLMRNLQHPKLSALKNWFDQHLPL